MSGESSASFWGPVGTVAPLLGFSYGVMCFVHKRPVGMAALRMLSVKKAHATRIHALQQPAAMQMASRASHEKSESAQLAQKPASQDLEGSSKGTNQFEAVGLPTQAIAAVRANVQANTEHAMAKSTVNVDNIAIAEAAATKDIRQAEAAAPAPQEKPKRKRRTKAEMAAARAEAEAAGVKKVKRKRRTKAEIEAARAAEMESSKPTVESARAPESASTQPTQAVQANDKTKSNTSLSNKQSSQKSVVAGKGNSVSAQKKKEAKSSDAKAKAATGSKNASSKDKRKGLITDIKIQPLDMGTNSHSVTGSATSRPVQSMQASSRTTV